LPYINLRIAYLFKSGPDASIKIFREQFDRIYDSWYLYKYIIVAMIPYGPGWGNEAIFGHSGTLSIRPEAHLTS
jgi:hypothetical protein